MGEKSLNELTLILQSLTKLHESLLDMMKKKQQVLVKGEVQELLSILSEESKIVKQIGEAEVQRTKLVENKSSVTLSQYINLHGDTSQQQEWKQMQEQLLTLLSDIRTINRTNELLLQQSLAFTQYMMDQLLPSTHSSGYYKQNDTVLEASEPNRFFDAKA